VLYYRFSLFHFPSILSKKNIPTGTHKTREPPTNHKHINHLFETFISPFEEDNHYTQITCSLVLELEDENSTFAQPVRDMLRILSTLIEKILGKGQSNREINPDFDLKLLSLNILGLLFGNTIPWALNKDRTNYRVIMESQKELLLNSIII
jgi:hypothetical protein